MVFVDGVIDAVGGGIVTVVLDRSQIISGGVERMREGDRVEIRCHVKGPRGPLDPD